MRLLVTSICCYEQEMCYNVSRSVLKWAKLKVWVCYEHILKYRRFYLVSLYLQYILYG